jgi:thiamine-phosphate pyrophosphorylase
VTLPDPPLLLITDRRIARHPLPDVVAAALEAGCRWIMVREKDLGTADLTDLAGEVVAAARPFGATVLVNGDIAAARASGAGGVHLPQAVSVSEAREFQETGALVGVSAHSLAEAEQAAADGADYVTLSPVFASVSKPGYGPAVGLDRLEAAARALRIRVIALGGVTPANAGDCMAAGAAGIAVLGTVMQADDPATVTKALVDALRTAQLK